MAVTLKKRKKKNVSLFLLTLAGSSADQCGGGNLLRLGWHVLLLDDSLGFEKEGTFMDQLKDKLRHIKNFKSLLEQKAL